MVMVTMIPLPTVHILEQYSGGKAGSLQPTAKIPQLGPSGLGRHGIDTTHHGNNNSEVSGNDECEDHEDVHIELFSRPQFLSIRNQDPTLVILHLPQKAGEIPLHCLRQISLMLRSI